jgi:hypothetical protein
LKKNLRGRRVKKFEHVHIRKQVDEESSSFIDAVSKNEQVMFMGAVCYNVNNFKLELMVLECEFRNLMTEVDYYTKLSRTEVEVIRRGQEVDLKLLSSEERIRILMG